MEGPVRPVKNRERILSSSVELFNLSGVVAVTTNHIAEHLKISPGNLYFHFANKEEIIRELFDRMCQATYEVWRADLQDPSKTHPIHFVQRSYEVFWNYRFFHREMYHLRRKDPQLARKWRSHITKTVRLLNTAYHHWVEAGIMKRVADPKEMQMISDVVLITSSSFLNFFESHDRPASRKSVHSGVQHVARLLRPYHESKFQDELETYL
jgi:AcrR family transcriptional regulator